MIEAMKQAFDKACEAMEAAGKRIDELKAENASLRQAIAEAEKQEPVDWENATKFIADEAARAGLCAWSKEQWVSWALNQRVEKTSPPQRQWVGLTPQERDEINEQVYGAVPHHVAFHHAIEAKLRIKNGM